jgi:hypothetical protein
LVTWQSTRQILLVTTRLANRSLAWERGQHVLSILAPRVLHAGLGLTWERVGDVFRRSFGGADSTPPPPGTWPDRGPLQIWEGYPSLWNLAAETGGVVQGRGLAVLYAVPSALKAKLPGKAPLSMDAGTDVTIELVPRENLNEVPSRFPNVPVPPKNDLRSWVTFPLMELQLPVYVSRYSAGELKIQLAENSGLSSVLRPYDEMHYLRAERFQVQNNNLMSEELKTRWTDLETRVDGVLEMWFEWIPSKKLLTAWVLTAGGPASLGKSSRPKEWPSGALWRSEFELHDLVVVQDSWILRNL